MKKRLTKIKHAVILVNYKSSTDTLAAIASIKKCKDQPYIIVVDNGSPQTVINELRANAPEVDMLEAGSNIGFSAGNNLGIKHALRLGAQVIYLLNNDTLVDPNLFFRAYRSCAVKNRIVGAKVYYARGYEYHDSQKNAGNILWYAGGYFDYSMAIARHIGVDEIDHGQYDKSKAVDFVTGCFMAIPRGVIKKIGMLDESFFLYLEDAEYSLRAISRGVEVLYNPLLILYHKNSSSAGAGSALVDYYMSRNRHVIAKRYGTWRLRFALLREAFKNFGNANRRQAYTDYLFGKMGERK